MPVAIVPFPMVIAVLLAALAGALMPCHAWGQGTNGAGGQVGAGAVGATDAASGVNGQAASPAVVEEPPPDRSGAQRAVEALLGMPGALSPTGTPTAQGGGDAAGSPDAPVDRITIDTSSPRETMRTFLRLMFNREERPERELRVMDLFVPATVEEFDDMRRRELARQIYGVINRVERVDVDSSRFDVDTSNENRTVFRYFPDTRLSTHTSLMHRLYGDEPPGELAITMRRLPDGRWLFDETTVRSVPRLFTAMKDMPLMAGQRLWAEWIEQQAPPWMVENALLGVRLWQWFAVLAVIAIGVVLDFSVRVFSAAVTRAYLRRFRESFEDADVRRAARPFGLLAATLFWLASLRFTDLGGLAATILSGGLSVFASLLGIMAVWRLIDVGAELLLLQAAHTRTRFDDVLVPLVRKTLKIFTAVVGLVLGANALDIDIWPLVASLGIGGVAFAFAAKDTVENLFGSIAVLTDRPFDVGDWVKVDDTEGTVEEVGFRSTRIRTFYNSQVTVPNANLVRAVVDNMGRRKYRRWNCHVGVQYDTTPEQLLAFAEGIRELVRTHPYTRKDYFQVWVNQFGASSIDILVYVFHEVPDWSTELRERERLIVDMVRLADALGVQFAFPTQTVHLYKEEHAPYERQHEKPGRLTDRRGMVRGIRAAQQLMADQPWRGEKPGPVTYAAGPTDLSHLSEEERREAAKYEVTENTTAAEVQKLDETIQAEAELAEDEATAAETEPSTERAPERTNANAPAGEPPAASGNREP